MSKKPFLRAIATALSIVIAACATTATTGTSASGDPLAGSGPLTTDSMREIDSSYQETLDRLYATAPGIGELLDKARGVMIVTRAIKAGDDAGGGEYGRGLLKVDGSVDSYYKTTSTYIGRQRGAEPTAIVFLFLTQDALDRFRATRGWVVGAGLSAASFLRSGNGFVDATSVPTIAFVTTNTGLLANVSLKGIKVTKIE